MEEEKRLEAEREDERKKINVTRKICSTNINERKNGLS